MMPMDLQPTNVYDALGTFDDIYSPRIVSRMNDYDVRIAHTRGDYVWHTHEDTDEFFLVLDGHFAVSLRDTDGIETTVELRRGDTFVVPRGIEHRPSSHGGAILMFEPVGTVSTGDVGEADLPEEIQPTTGHEL
jgi:mannose-6-phosphate isomerase-like protein (cupin superfamily)